VRDIYRAGDDLLIVAKDRISAFDYILASGIPRKGEVLTQLSLFWFDFLKDVVRTHLITADVDRYHEPLPRYRDQLEDRSMLVRRARMLEVECVARGYLSRRHRTAGGSGRARAGHLVVGGGGQAARAGRRPRAAVARLPAPGALAGGSRFPLRPVSGRRCPRLRRDGPSGTPRRLPGELRPGPGDLEADPPGTEAATAHGHLIRTSGSTPAASAR
jgi:hypothetical protein